MDWAPASGASSWRAAAADPGPTMLSFAGPSSSSSSSAAAEARLQDFAADLVQRARPAGAGRRSRASGGGGGVEACSVDGCRSDLSRCREYHRRHRVCEAHSKTPVVVVGGQEQRFCQQCSRTWFLCFGDLPVPAGVPATCQGTQRKFQRYTLPCRMIEPPLSAFDTS